MSLLPQVAVSLDPPYARGKGVVALVLALPPQASSDRNPQSRPRGWERALEDWEEIVRSAAAGLGLGDAECETSQDHHGRGASIMTRYEFDPTALADPTTWIDAIRVAVRDIQALLDELASAHRAPTITGILEGLGFAKRTGEPTNDTKPAQASQEDDSMLAKTIWSHLREKGAVVLQGPPGTGKTHHALAVVNGLAAGSMGAVSSNPDVPDQTGKAYRLGALVGAATADSVQDPVIPADARVVYEVVQMHPGYAYEDFVQGLRSKSDGQGFEIRPGILERMARAAKTSKVPFILILDEMNRCNPSSVFGELLFLLERTERGRREVQLQYEGSLDLPPNVYFIGTMNTADRSIALVDFAIRRRFRFIDIPAEEGALSSFYGARQDRVATEARAAYKVLAAAQVHHRLPPTHHIGPAFFMLPEGDPVEALWNNIWYEVLPQVREYEAEGVEKAKEVRMALEVVDGWKRPESP